MKTSLLVYLAGSITGLTLEEVTGWRKKVTPLLEDAGFTVLDPCRGLMFLNKEDVVKDGYDQVFSETKHTVFLRDKYDSTRADVLIINLIGAKHVSIGTMFELAWAHLSGKFPVVVMEREGSIYMHAFVREAAGVIVDNLDEAVDYIIRTFSAEKGG